MKQHLHNKIGNVVGSRKRELYSRLKSGADLEKEIEAFIADISNELQSIVPSESFPDAIDSPTRSRNDLADAVGEILTNDLAPTRLRNAVVNHVTDAHNHEENTAHEHETPSTETTPDDHGDEPGKLPYGQDSINLIERLARRSLHDCDPERNLALLELLTYIYHDSSWAMWARNAVIANSVDLLDQAADVLFAKAKADRVPR